MTDTNVVVIAGKERLNKLWVELSALPERVQNSIRVAECMQARLAMHCDGESTERFFALFDFFAGDWRPCVDPEISNWVADTVEKCIEQWKIDSLHPDGSPRKIWPENSQYAWWIGWDRTG